MLHRASVERAHARAARQLRLPWVGGSGCCGRQGRRGRWLWLILSGLLSRAAQAFRAAQATGAAAAAAGAKAQLRDITIEDVD